MISVSGFPHEGQMTYLSAYSVIFSFTFVADTFVLKTRYCSFLITAFAASCLLRYLLMWLMGRSSVSAIVWKLLMMVAFPWTCPFALGMLKRSLLVVTSGRSFFARASISW